MPKVIITGSTGMVGKGVLLECLESSFIEKVLVINRRKIDLNHPKLQEVLLADFTKVDTIKNELTGYDGCFHCMGVSVVGQSEASYTKIIYHTTKALADILYELNPSLLFNFVSGAGTDSTEKSRAMWARVKGKTENLVLQKGFNDAYAFRPGLILPEKGIKSKTIWYNAAYLLFRPFFSMMKKSKNITTTTKMGLAMINTLRFPQANKFLENKDINELAEK